MNHSFNIEIAKEYGIEEAIILENMYFWIEKNRVNGKHVIDGQVWTYNSQAALAELFPYMNRSKIQRVMIKLEDLGLINRANYNVAKYDKTTWYALTPHGYSLFNMNNGLCNLNNGLLNMNNRISQNEQPIPDINTNINSDINHIDNIPYQEIIDLLNKKANKRYKNTIKKTRDLIKARFNEGFNFYDFELVIAKKCSEWLGTEFEKFLRPETLFSNKFEGYLNQKEAKNGEHGTNNKPIKKFNIKREEWKPTDTDLTGDMPL